MTNILPQNRKACISLIREAFGSCLRPTPEVLSPNGGIDGPYVHKNWGHLTRRDVEAFECFGSYLAEDVTYMSSIAFRYYVPSVMILFLSHPDRIDFGGFISMISRCESAFQCRADAYAFGQIALTRPHGVAFHEWFGLLMTIIKKFQLGSFEAEYMQRLRMLRRRSKTFTSDTDFDSETIDRIGKSRSRSKPKA